MTIVLCQTRATQSIYKFIVCIILSFMTSLLFSCAHQTPKTIQEARQTLGQTLQKIYDGPEMTVDQVAVVIPWAGRIYQVDGIDVKGSIELLPGQHNFNTECRASYKGESTRNFTLEADLKAGHIYEYRCLALLYSLYPFEFAVSIVDVNTNELVAGRPKEAMYWSWDDFQRELMNLKNKKASKHKVIEMLTGPYWPGAESWNVVGFEPYSSYVLDPNLTLGYLVKPSRYGIIMPNYEFSSPRLEISETIIPQDESPGMLFLEFNTSDQLTSYFFVESPYSECIDRIMPLGWQDLSEVFYESVCKDFSNAWTIAHYLASTNKPYESYLTLEKGFLYFEERMKNLRLSKDRIDLENTSYYEKKLNKVNMDLLEEEALEKIINMSNILLDKYPQILDEAKSRSIEVYQTSGNGFLQYFTDK